MKKNKKYITLKDEDFIGKIFKQEKDSLLVIEKTIIKNNNNHYLFRCQFQKYPYEIFETKDHILRGQIGNPITEKYEFLNNKFLQNCGDFLIPIEKTNLQNKNKDHFYYKCKFIGKYSCEVFALKRNILKGEVWNPKNPNCLNKQERDLYFYIKSIYNNKNIIKNNWSILETKEIDIYIPELKIGFEFNGIYWHSKEQKDKYYHLNKLKLANSKGIKLYFIWEDEWKNNKEEIKQWIKDIIFKGKSQLFSNQVDKIGIWREEYSEPQLILRDNRCECWNCGFKK